MMASRRRWGMVALVAALLMLGAFGSLAAQTGVRGLPALFNEVEHTSGLSNPTAMAFAPDGRLFVLEQGGQIRVVPAGGGAPLAAPFWTTSVNSSGERGLLGIAFHPNFSSNNLLYVYYTLNTSPPRNRLSRLTANGNTVAPNSEVILAEFENLTATNHNGGALLFGTDRKLYVAVGDNNVPSNAQTLNNRLGKILRYNPDGTIPSDNPFYTTASGGNRAIWALGLRNPYTFAVRRTTGRIFINDVGQGSWEEVNPGAAGANYGWPTTEGDFNQGQHPTFTRPAYTYGHSGGACAITGGAFYDPASVAYPADYVGDYFFADYCANWIRRFDPSSGSAVDFATGTSINRVVDLRVGPDGLLYALSRANGRVYRYTYSGVVPTATFTPSQTPNSLPVPSILSPTTGLIYRAGQTISFSGRATDAEDGVLAASRLSWKVEFHHDDHTHPFILQQNGVTGGTFVIPRRGVDNDATNVFYRVTLTATDRNGGSSSTFVDVLPQLVSTTLESVPSGLQVQLDGRTVTTPYTFESVAGVGRTISAPIGQTAGSPHTFTGWAVGSSALPVPSFVYYVEAAQTLTVNYGAGQAIPLMGDAGGFEFAGAGNLPLDWQPIAGMNPSLASRLCDVSGGATGEQLYSFEGTCALRIVGQSAQPQAHVYHTLSPVALAGLQAGDVVTFSSCTRQLGAVFSGIIQRARLTYADGTTQIISLPSPTARRWSCQTVSQALTGTPTSGTVVVRFRSTTGNLRFDAVGLWARRAP